MKLVEATPAQKRARDLLTHPEWGRSLTPAQYLAREERLRAHPWSRAGMTTWLWVDDAGAPLSSCETFCSESTLEGLPGHALAIASVFTEPGLRGRGHATAMLTALSTAVRARDSRAQALVLFSDVGAAIYRRAGYLETDALDLRLPPAPGDPAEGVTPITLDTAADALAAAAPLRGRFGIHPTLAQLDWHWERGRIYADALSRPISPMLGAQAHGATAFWVSSPRDLRLLVLLTRGPREGLEAVLRSAQRLADQAGYADVVAWVEPGLDRDLAARLGGGIEPRSGSLPMVRPLVKGLGPADWLEVPRALWV